MFENELIFIQESFDTKMDAIEFMIKEAYGIGKLSEIKDYRESVLKREDEFSTAIGYEVAIPHGFSDHVKEPFVVVVTLKEVMEWDNEKVKMIFMIGVPKSKRTIEHLKILAWLSKNLMHEDFRKMIALSKDKETLYKCLKKLETEGG